MGQTPEFQDGFLGGIPGVIFGTNPIFPQAIFGMNSRILEVVFGMNYRFPGVVFGMNPRFPGLTCPEPSQAPPILQQIPIDASLVRIPPPPARQGWNREGLWDGSQDPRTVFGMNPRMAGEVLEVNPGIAGIPGSQNSFGMNPRIPGWDKSQNGRRAFWDESQDPRTVSG